MIFGKSIGVASIGRFASSLAANDRSSTYLATMWVAKQSYMPFEGGSLRGLTDVSNQIKRRHDGQQDQ